MPRVSVHDMWMIGACPVCGADPGAECLSKLGNRTKGYIHMARYDPHSGVTVYSNNHVTPLLRAGPRLDIALANYPLAQLTAWTPADVVNHPPLRERLNGRKFPGSKRPKRRAKSKVTPKPVGHGAWLAERPLAIEEN